MGHGVGAASDATAAQPLSPTSDGRFDTALVMLAGIDVQIDRTPVLRGLNLRIDPGEVVGVTGANGCGKTTLLRVLATLSAPTAGHGHVLGAELGSRASARVRARIGLIGHLSPWYPQLTLRENLGFLARLGGCGDGAAAAALRAVGLGRAGGRRADGCSAGMLRRAELAWILLADPTLLLLDEVHTGLDAAAVGLVDHVVERAQRRGGAAVLVSHDHHRLEALADRRLELSDGRLVTPAGASS